MSKVFVTGMGVISAIGNNSAENLKNLRDGKSGVGPAKYLKSNYGKSHPFAEVKISTEELKARLEFKNKKGVYIMWTTPAATEMRFGFEVTMYVMNK